MKRVLIILLIVILAFQNSQSQSVAINNDGSSANPRSLLDIKSNSKGVFLPRMTSAQRLSIPVQSDDAGLLVFDTDKQSLYIYTGSKWMPISFNSEQDVLPVNYTASDVTASNFFGCSVSVKGDYAVVGAFGKDASKGAAYVFQHTSAGWTQQAKLTASDGVASDAFGYSVSVYGDDIVVGAIGCQINGKLNQGAAYIFSRNGNTWIQQTKLTATDGNAGDAFGVVSLDGNRLVIGAQNHKVGNNNQQGAAYVFLKVGANWSPITKLVATDGAEFARFGSSIDIYGNNLIIGAVFKRVNNVLRGGGAYIYSSTNGISWTEEKIINNSLPVYEDCFGYSVAINNGIAAIGIPGKDQQVGSDAGQVDIYLYDNATNTWVYNEQLKPYDETPGSWFGNSVALTSNMIIVGAYLKTNVSTNSQGAVYLYKKASVISPFLLQRKINDSEPAFPAQFGNACSIDPSTGRFIIGAQFKNGNAGSVSLGNLY